MIVRMKINAADDTRTRIIKSTIILFNKYGPMVPMSKISEMAGIAAGTPFKHFKAKEELLLAAYRYAREKSYEIINEDPRTKSTTQELIKTIIRYIIRWATLMPDEHEYVIKYENYACFNYYAPEFRNLYEGIVEELDIWDRIKHDVRQDLNAEIISRIISVQCSVFILYMSFHKMQPDTPQLDALIEASADSIWNSIKRVNS